MKDANEQQAILQAVAKARGLTMQALQAEMAHHYAEAYALEMIGAEGIKAALEPIQSKKDMQQKRQREQQEQEKMAREGMTQAEIGHEFGVGRATVSKKVGDLRQSPENEQAAKIARPMLRRGAKPHEIVTALQEAGDPRHAEKLRHVIRRVRQKIVRDEAAKVDEMTARNADLLKWANEVSGRGRIPAPACPTQHGNSSE